MKKQVLLAFLNRAMQDALVSRAETYAANLADALAAKGMTRQELQNELAKLGVRVSEQAVGAWLRAEYSPRPTHQAAIARVLEIPVHLLFPVTFDPELEGAA